MTIKEEIESARRFGEQLEDLIFQGGEFRLKSDRSSLIIGYWSLLFDFHNSIVVLLGNEFFGGAFALIRPEVEGLVRAHVVHSGSDEEVERIQRDTYRMNFKTIGSQIDRKYCLEGLFENLLKNVRLIFHSFTHSGVAQLARRFDGKEVGPRYSETEILGVINVTTSAVFMMTLLITEHFGFESERTAANALFTDYGKRPPE